MLKLTAFVIVPPPPKLTSYAWAAVFSVVIVTDPWNDTVPVVSVKVTVPADKVPEKVTPVLFVTVRVPLTVVPVAKETVLVLFMVRLLNV